MQTDNILAAAENCRYCLMCRHVCPVGHVTHLETLTPHGWGLTIASVRRGLLAWDADTVAALYHCADCGTCRSHCVTDQPLPEAIAAARAEVVELGLAPASVVAAARKLAEFGNPFEARTPEPANGSGEVALFVGDEAAYCWPAGLDAALKLLAAIGIRPVLIGRGRNNGYLASSLGYPNTARDLAQATLAELAAAGARQMLVLSPGDYFTFHKLYDERLGVAWPRRVEVREVVELLAGALATGDLHFRRAEGAVEYAYLDPTHTVRVDGRWTPPRRLLEAILAGPRRELFWRQERTHPTGATALQFSMPHLSMILASARLEDAQKTGARLIITEAAGDLALLSRLAPRFGLQLRGLYELLAEHLA
jgi:Fe-S oxidoreductase